MVSKLPANMSVKLKFSSPSDGLAAVGRSRSFAGFSTLQVRKTSQSLRKNSVKSKMSVRSEKLYPSLKKGSIRLDPHPHQVKKIFEALRKGLNEYLEEHQTQLDFLAGQQKDIKRNSRLGFVYDLDKEIRLIERHIRKLEFHISKIEELYETYCIQWRLRVGTCNMKHAFSLSPSTRASRESLIELSKNFQECTEDMCMIEGALEVHLGEFLIKMKGLVGYARLCPGDHYEVLIRLGRQRWRLKGKIETDDSQVWDEEERIFIPNLCENFEIKVIELRGLTTIMVGVVTCDSADFFTTRPRVIIVDITELGTIKLQLEVTWNPFDNSKILSTPGMANKFSSSVRKMSLYHWTPPNTPSFRDKFYLQNDLDSTYPSLEKDIQTPYILSYLANSGFVRDRQSLEHSMELNSMDSLRNLEIGDETVPSPPSSCGETETLPYSSQELTRDEQPPGHETLDILRETPNRYSTHDAMKPSMLEFDKKPSPEITENGKNPSSVPEENKDNTAADGEGKKRSLPRQIDDVLDLLRSEDATRWKMKELEQSVLNFRERVLRSCDSRLELPSMDSLMVETALESFDFLNTDFSTDDLSLFGSVRTHSKSNETVTPSVTHAFSCHSESEKDGLSTGHEDLDTLLSIHLDICKALLKKLTSPNTARIIQHHLLDELSWQREVLEDMSIIYIQKAQEKASIEDIFPKSKKIRHFLKLWESCIKPECPWFCSSEVFLNQLKKMFVLKIKAKYPGQLEAVFRRALEQIFGFGGVMASNEIPESIVSIFLFYGYLQRYHVVDLEKHFAALTREVTLIGDLQLPGRLKKIRKLKAKQISRLQPLPQFLKLVATFQIDENMKLCKVAMSFLSRASANKHFKQKAVLYYTELLSDKDVKLQRSACLALKHLKGTASIDQIAGLCQSEVEDVRITARETILSFGQKGRHTFGKTDKICRELQETLTLDGEIEITVF
ncbi:RIPOR family member 3 isoform X1 [Bufo bufo]|uniref:RIPOR family member 3 isoform X1 n=2 Tax=Bufo bufo TaxID=8384 RepID=UPI001ABE4690|nr:RIPOR family member 3 isoform X1 [Bufo bufo]